MPAAMAMKAMKAMKATKAMKHQKQQEGAGRRMRISGSRKEETTRRAKQRRETKVQEAMTRLVAKADEEAAVATSKAKKREDWLQNLQVAEDEYEEVISEQKEKIRERAYGEGYGDGYAVGELHDLPLHEELCDNCCMRNSAKIVELLLQKRARKRLSKSLLCPPRAADAPPCAGCHGKDNLGSGK